MTICNITATEPINCTAEETVALSSSTASLTAVQVQFVAFVISLQVELAGRKPKTSYCMFPRHFWKPGLSDAASNPV